MLSFVKFIDKILSYHIHVDDYSEKAPITTIRNFLCRNSFLRYLYRWDEKKNKRGLGVFIVKQDDPKYKILEKCLIFISKAGFDIVAICPFSSSNLDDRLYRIKPSTKFWTSKYDINCIVVFDKNPLSMYSRVKNNWPFWKVDDSFLGNFYYNMIPRMDNRRLLIKNSIRIAIKASVPKNLRMKYIHSSDNFEEAIEYINIIAPEKLEKILLYIDRNTVKKKSL